MGLALVIVLTCANYSAAQAPFDTAVRDLSSADAAVRLRAVRMLEESASPESAVPLASAVADSDAAVRTNAIAAELNIFLDEKIGGRRSTRSMAESAFARGPLALGPLPVPMQVLTALRTAIRDTDPRVAREALYAFGTLAVAPSGDERRALLRAAVPDLVSLIGASNPDTRLGAVQVAGRVFAWRPDDEAVDAGIGDALTHALNDSDRAIKSAAMRALGDVRFGRSVQALTELFGFYEKGELAEQAFAALARIAPRTSASLFEEQLTSKNAAFVRSAAEGLTRLGERDALPQIETGIGTARDESVQLARAFASAALGAGSVDAVADAVRRSRLRDQAIEYLAELLRVRSSDFPRLVQDPDPALRTAIADAIALSRDRAALPLAEMLAKDPDPQVARAAARGVQWLSANHQAENGRND